MEGHDKLFLIEVIKAVMNCSNSSNSSYDTASDDDDEVNDRQEQQLLYAFLSADNRREINPIPRIMGFTETVVPSYSEETFKGHFRFVAFHHILSL